MIKNRLNNYLIPPKNGHLMHVDPQLYTKCPLGGLLLFEHTISHMSFIFMVLNGLLVKTFKHPYFSQYFMHILLLAR